MPILEQGYQPYKGSLRKGGRLFLSVSREALRRNNRWWVWALAVVCFLAGSLKEYILVFVVYIPSALFSVDPKDIPDFFRLLTEHPRFYTDMMATQSLWAILLGLVLGAGEIAEDLRSGALTFLLGRPVTRTDYILGKAFAVSLPIVCVTLVPLLILFFGQALFEANGSWFTAHWTLPLRAVAYCGILCFFTSGVVLGISAVARRRLWATVAVVGSLFTLSICSGIFAPALAYTSRAQQGQLHRLMEHPTTREERREAMQRYADAFDDLGSISENAGWKFLSPWASLTACARDVFGNAVPANFSGGRHWLLVFGLPTLFLGVLLRRVRAVEVVT